MTGLTRQGKKLVLGFPYSADKVEQSKNIGYSKYDPDTKTRSYDIRLIEPLIQFCQQHNLPISDDAQSTLQEIDNYPEIEWHNAGPRIYIGPSKSDLPEHVNTEKSGAWIYVSSRHVHEVIEWGKQNDKRIDPELIRYANRQFIDEASNYQMGTALEAEELPVKGLVSTPLPEQWVPAHVIKKNRKAILADEQGLGKTLEALMIARVEGDEAQRMIIICPDRLTQNWIDEMHTHFEQDMFTPWIATSRKPKPIPEEVDVVVIGWTILGSWANHLKQWKPDFIVSDEGHYAKAGKVVTRTEDTVEINEKTGAIESKKTKKKVSGSQRGSAIHSLLGSLSEQDRALFMTGTPIPNRPTELLPILQALKIEGAFGGTQLYKMRYCDGKQKYIGGGRGPGGSGYVWDFSGGSNLMELNSRLLSSGHYIRRTKQHLVNAGRLPNKIVDDTDFYDFDSVRQPTILQGSPDAMKEYVEAEYGLTEELAAKAVSLSRRYRCKVTSQKVMSKLAAEIKKQSDGIFTLRRLAGIAGISEVVDLVRKEYLDKREKVIIVAHHREVVDSYVEAFDGAVKIQGSMTTKQIEKAKAQFNAEGFDHPVMVLALEAGKTGHTLCKQPDQSCANMVIAESVWNPSDAWQVQDRIWRIGQPRPVNIRNAVVGGTVQETIYSKSAEKERNVYAAIDGITFDRASDDKSVAGEIAMQLATRGLEATQ